MLAESRTRKNTKHKRTQIGILGKELPQKIFVGIQLRLCLFVGLTPCSTEHPVSAHRKEEQKELSPILATRGATFAFEMGVHLVMGATFNEDRGASKVHRWCIHYTLASPRGDKRGSLPPPHPHPRPGSP